MGQVEDWVAYNMVMCIGDWIGYRPHKMVMLGLDKLDLVAINKID